MQNLIKTGKVFTYLISLPNDYDSKKEYPLVLFLHGAGERGNGENIDIVKLNGPPKLCEREEFDAIILSPQCKIGQVWNSYSHQLKELIEDVVKNYSINKDAISITGLSMGGFGAYQVLMDYPELFSAAVIVSGGGMEWRSGVIQEIPLKIYHGEQDDCVPVYHAKEMYTALLNGGAKDVSITLFPKEGHCIWEKVYEETDVMQWLINKRK